MAEMEVGDCSGFQRLLSWFVGESFELLDLVLGCAKMAPFGPRISHLGFGVCEIFAPWNQVCEIFAP